MRVKMKGRASSSEDREQDYTEEKADEKEAGAACPEGGEEAEQKEEAAIESEEQGAGEEEGSEKGIKVVCVCWLHSSLFLS